MVEKRPRGVSEDEAVGSVASALGMLVVLARIPSLSRTGVMATTGVVLGCLLGARWLGAATILFSAGVILVWLLA